jgi:hypothetical protein
MAGCGPHDHAFSISGTSVTKNLAGRIIRADPFDPSNSKRTQEEEFLHEGLHQSSEERKALGFFGKIRMGHDQNDHQDAYNDAANSYLEPSQ